MYVNVDGINIYYETFGSGSPILIIHGFGIDSTVMKGALEPVFGNPVLGGRINGFMRIYFDLPGMGETRDTVGIKNADSMLDLIVGFKEKIIPDVPFSVVGYSYGGYLARGVLKREFERVKGVFLLCPVIYPDKKKRNLPPFRVVERDSWVNEIVKGMDNLQDGDFLPGRGAGERKTFEKFLESVVVQNKYTYKRYLKEVYTGLLNVDKGFLKEYQAKGYAFSFDPDVLDKPFDGPAVILTGKQDSVVGYTDSFKLINNYPRGSFVVLDGAGHTLPIEKPEIFELLFADWLRGLQE